MGVNLEKMLERCRREQWSVNDFDWSGRPLALAPEREREICTYFVNMSYIERLAGALFLALAKRVDDPTLAAIFATFHADELRHSHAAARLADYFDIHHYQVYTPNIPMLRFIPAFVGLIESVGPAYANNFILGGELILDMALLRGLDAYVDDPLCRAVVDRINQDESRHLAIDMYMTEYFARPGHGGGNPWLDPNWWSVLAWAPGFFAEVFFRPMQRFDPSQAQMREVMRRLRRFYDRASVAANPAVREFQAMAAFLESRAGALLGGALTALCRRLFGLDFDFVRAASSAELYGSGEVRPLVLSAAHGGT
ncbi:MAG TPA: hypothetical protein VNO26_15470 [Candidatus Limnocylindria bacterium]|nr:hypothetical protein [Candidatus Limnocylindria bacterium]